MREENGKSRRKMEDVDRDKNPHDVCTVQERKQFVVEGRQRKHFRKAEVGTVKTKKFVGQ